MKKVISKSAETTRKLGKELAKDLKAGDVLLLYGDLGAGKTTFVQGVAEGLGIKKRVLSPTFVLMRSYKSEKNNLHHMDLYRIEKKEDLTNLGVADFINEDDSILVIEWPEKLKNYKMKSGYKIYFDYLNKDERSINLKRIHG